MTVDEALADRLERAMAESMHMRGAALEHVEGNPLAIEQRTFDGLHARLVGTDLAYYRYFSGPARLRSENIAVVPELVDWYAHRNAPCFVRLSPLLASADLLRALSVAGLAQTDFMSLLYGTTGTETPAPVSLRYGTTETETRAPVSLLYGTTGTETTTPAGIRVAEIAHTDLSVFLTLWTAAAPDDERALRQRLAQAEFTHWRCYVAFVDERPAAHAALFISAETRTGVLAATATLPEMRARGCHAALVRRRLRDAALAGCDLVAVEATPGSASQRNLERLGLRLAYTRVIWSRELLLDSG